MGIRCSGTFRQVFGISDDGAGRQIRMDLDGILVAAACRERIEVLTRRDYYRMDWPPRTARANTASMPRKCWPSTPLSALA